MKTWVRRSMNAGALTAGVLLVSGAAAHASPTMTSSDNVGLLNGTQALLPIQAPINICGNAVGVGGAALAGCEGGAAAALNPEWRFDHYQGGHDRGSPGGPAMTTADNLGIGNGTQIHAPVQMPVNACGNAVAVLGSAGAGCEGGAEAELGPDRPGHGWGKGKGHHGYGKESGKPTAEVVATNHADPAMTTSGNVGILNGTQVLAPIQVPINICGNAISVLGVAQAACEGGSDA